MNAIETISQQLEAFFAEQDAKIADGDVQWAPQLRGMLCIVGGVDASRTLRSS